MEGVRARVAPGCDRGQPAEVVGPAFGMAGAVKNRIGQVIDNEQMAAEGKAKEIKGEAKKKANE